MIGNPIIKRTIGALAILVLVSFHAVSAWAAACTDCANMSCCPSATADTPPTDQISRASCCEVAPLEAMHALDELTSATIDSQSLDTCAVVPAVDAIDVQAPLVRVEQPGIFPRALASPPTRTTVLLL